MAPTEDTRTNIALMGDDSPEAKGAWAAIKANGELFSALVLAACGVVGSVLVLAQWRVMRQQTSLIQQQTRVMQQQLADSERSSAESEKVTERQLRIAESQAASLRALAESNTRLLAIAESQGASLRHQAESP
jgi:uncharacterized protein HemX